LQEQFSLSSESVVWRALCFLALAVSIAAAICTNLMRSQDTAGKVSAAEAANAELDSLKTMLEFGNLRLDPALELYRQSTVKVAFVDEKLTGLPT
jgi:hypothetical protein